MSENYDYEIFEHTADIGIIVRGKTIEEMFEKAAYAMFDLMVDAEKIESAGKYRVELTAQDLEDLVVDWLSELLYVFTTELFVMGDFNVWIDKVGEEYALKAICLGEPYKKDKHGIKMEIKAVTYHELEINLEKGYLKVLFDI